MTAGVRQSRNDGNSEGSEATTFGNVVSTRFSLAVKIKAGRLSCEYHACSTQKSSMRIETKRLLRKLPYIGSWHMFRVIYSQAELERLEAEVKSMQADYDRLIAEGPDVLEETRQHNPRLSSELHIHELVRFRASRLKKDIDLKMWKARDARRYVE